MGLSAGVYHGVPFDEYLLDDAINNSSMSWLDESPAYYRFRKDNPRPIENKPQFRLGGAAHAATLEPEVFDVQYALEPDVSALAPDAKSPRSTKAYKDAIADLEANGATVLKVEEWNAAVDISHRFREHPVVGQLLRESSGMETTFVWERDGLLCKARFDFYGAGWIADLKTTRNLSGFSPWEISRWQLNRQLAWYRSGAIACGLDIEGCYLAAVDSSPPHEVGVFELDPAAMDAGAAKCNQLWDLYRRCLDSGKWPGRYPDQVMPGSITDREYEAAMIESNS